VIGELPVLELLCRPLSRRRAGPRDAAEDKVLSIDRLVDLKLPKLIIWMHDLRARLTGGFLLS
jgi:hypothetical protein